MSVLVTRPEPDNEATAAALRAKGFEPLLAPMLLFQPLPFQDEGDGRYTGLVITSANAIRAIAGRALLQQMQGIPVFAVGARTAQAARDAGFSDVHSAEGDAAALRDLVIAHLPPRRRAALLYLSAAEVSRDLAGELGLRGVEVAAIPVYRMLELGELPQPVRESFARGTIEAILHYSQRSALAFVTAARHAGLEISALALPQVCLSDQIANALRAAGANRLIVAAAPREEQLFAALEQTLRRQP